jgi:hypothetical protein
MISSPKVRDEPVTRVGKKNKKKKETQMRRGWKCSACPSRKRVAIYPALIAAGTEAETRKKYARSGRPEPTAYGKSRVDPAHRTSATET